jgi:hypothetical protein
MKKVLIISLFLSLFFISGCSKKTEIQKLPPDSNMHACTLEAKICPDGSAVGRTGANCEFTPCPVIATTTKETGESAGITYENQEYGFVLQLTPNWQNYSVSSTPIEYGNKVIIRHPKWTKVNPYEDIPILVYPLDKWVEWEKNNFDNYPTAAPFEPKERGRNNLYVFATAPRYNYDFQAGFEEVEKIINTITTEPVSR